MDFISNTKAQNDEMLREIGISHVDALFEDIPSEIHLESPVKDDGISEYEGMRFMESLAGRNTFSSFENYLGAGAYEHHVPAIVGPICSKSEFLTSYTPYQPEASQGMLQAIFEFQSAICALTGMDVANASLYDGASACAEGLLMALRCQPGRNKILVAQSLHPNYRGAVDQYLCPSGVAIETIPFLPDGSMDQDALRKSLDNTTAAVLVQYPHFFGSIDDIRSIQKQVKNAGAFLVICANPLAYGLYASAGDIGADIAVGDCQPLGIPLQFGGPFAGYIACRLELVRQLPGRIVGETVDAEGKRGFVLTLQTREQHIRREKATSNICTNQSLAALASLVTMVWYGKEGIEKLALTNYQRAFYLHKKLCEISSQQPFTSRPFFNEFVFRCPKPLAVVQNHFRKHGIEPGLDLSRFFPKLQNCLLVAVTETKSLSQLDRYVKLMKEM